jgi:hypothetical protein
MLARTCEGHYLTACSVSVGVPQLEVKDVVRGALAGVLGVDSTGDGGNEAHCPEFLVASLLLSQVMPSTHEPTLRVAGRVTSGTAFGYCVRHRTRVGLRTPSSLSIRRVFKIRKRTSTK